MGDIERLNQVVHVNPLARPVDGAGDRRRNPKEEQPRKDSIDLHAEVENLEQDTPEESQNPVETPDRVDFSA
ncbi:MAG: hypothetical protein ABL949_15495 [Fimbriimonadaceae bacterium]